MLVENTATGQPQAGNPEAQQPQAGAPNPQAGEGSNNSQNSNSQPNNGVDVTALQRELAEARAEAAKYRTEKNKQAHEAAQAEQERLKQQGEWQKLAETAQSELGQVKPQYETLQADYQTLASIMAKQVEATIKDWPKEVKEFDPGEGNLIARLQWLEKARPLAEKLKAAPPVQGNGPRPRPASEPPENDVQALIQMGKRYY